MKSCGCGCGESAPKGKTYIQGHYSRTPAAKRMHAARRKKDVVGNPSGICKCGCGEKAPIAATNRPDRGYYKGQHLPYIHGHKLRERTGPLAGGWRGGRNISPLGYIYLLRPDHPNATSYGYVLKHRLVMEEKLGRLLEPWEKVHHINGDREDNRPENLVVTTLSDHMKGHEPWKYRENIREQCSIAGRKGAEARWGKKKK